MFWNANYKAIRTQNITQAIQNVDEHKIQSLQKQFCY